MFPAIMPWPMTLTPANEAIGHENQKEKNLNDEKNTAMIWVFMQDVRIVLLSKSVRFGESRRKGIKYTILTYIYFLNL
jgi:hypothetical protein